MGYYTEFLFICKLKEDKEIIEFFDFLFNTEHTDDPFYDNITKPKHSFFNCERWDYLFFGGYATRKTEWNFNKFTREMKIHSHFKNYDNEIYLFLDFISNYIEPKVDSDVYGFSKSEDEDFEDIVFDNGKLKVVSK